LHNRMKVYFTIHGRTDQSIKPIYISTYLPIVNRCDDIIKYAQS